MVRFVGHGPLVSNTAIGNCLLFNTYASRFGNVKLS